MLYYYYYTYHPLLKSPAGSAQLSQTANTDVKRTPIKGSGVPSSTASTYDVIGIAHVSIPEVTGFTEPHTREREREDTDGGTADTRDGRALAPHRSPEGLAGSSLSLSR